MSEKQIIAETSHHENDEAELSRLESNIDEHEHSETNSPAPSTKAVWIITVLIIGLIAIIGVAWIATKRSSTSVNVEISEKPEGDGHSESEVGKEVKLDPESIESAGIEVETVTARPAVAKIYVTGAVELNPETTEMATPLVGGRIERVFFGVGDFVSKGQIVATIASPQLAQMHGKMHEAKTRYELAQRNLSRVQRSENRVAVLSAKARLDEADKTLKRTKRLIELGAGAGKDLTSAETTYRTAKAEYDFQTNIGLNKEIQEAKAEVETAEVDLRHIQDEMRALGVVVNLNQPDDHSKDTSLVTLKSPLSGVITERKFNAGAGIDAATPVFAISNLSTVYVIANVPESNVNRLVVGSIAEIRSESIGNIDGRISYIDPRLDETSRTARVRIEVPNTNGRLRAGMFTEVGFQAGSGGSNGSELVVNSMAIQREGEKAIVFVPKDDEPGAFEIREIEIGGETGGYTIVKSGLELGDKVVTKGSFTLKTQMQKGEMGEHGH
ncbi:MAG: efflux RND transporter periplasmic adaptor subunit [Blastocatellia bacterium]|nr:efflux RND transporter periplasmic adaptor subunit [Blastocatellia bacterium]